MKVVGLDFEVERVEQAEENIVVEKQGKVVEIEDIEGTFHNYFSILVPKVEAKFAKAYMHSNYFVMVVHMMFVHMFECRNLGSYLIVDFSIVSWH